MKWDVDFQCFVIRGDGRKCRKAGKQAQNRCRVDAMAVGGYISRVLFIDGGLKWLWRG
jgi:hypothetical protein